MSTPNPPTPPTDAALREACTYFGAIGGKVKSARKAEASRRNWIKALEKIKQARNKTPQIASNGTKNTEETP
jgi:hypothetical protein